MKKVVTGNELKGKMQEAINMLCDTVKTTLGPKGSNVIVDHSLFSPFITNDGVTIAENIESEDIVINTILELAKEVSIKTNEKVGDGTTTSLVLLQSLFNNGLKLIEKGKNPVVLKREMDELLPKLILEINKKSIQPTKKELYNIATISANSELIGKNITDAYLSILDSNSITIKEGAEEADKIILKKGYCIDTIIASQYFFKDQSKINLSDTQILLVNNYLNDLEDIVNVLNYIMDSKQSLVIIAEDYSDSFINQVVSLYLYNDANIYLLKAPEYGKNKIDVLKDLTLITNAKIIDDLDYVSETVLGNVSKITINKEEAVIEYEKNKKVIAKVNELKELLIESDIDERFINKRISMFQNGLVEIVVGAPTETERREKKMRYDDALCALASTTKGVVPGSGIVFYEIAENLNCDNDVNNLIATSLKEPFNQIMYNSGVDKREVINKIKISDFKIIYNVSKDVYEKVEATEVVDPTYVLINTLTNAISIAGMLLTTTSLVINEHDNNINKISSYTEL